MKILQKFEISHENQFFFPFDKIIYLAICDIIAKKNLKKTKNRIRAQKRNSNIKSEKEFFFK